jgi:hypothetical protein
MHASTFTREPPASSPTLAHVAARGGDAGGDGADPRPGRSRRRFCCRHKRMIVRRLPSCAQTLPAASQQLKPQLGRVGDWRGFRRWRRRFQSPPVKPCMRFSRKGALAAGPGNVAQPQARARRDAAAASAGHQLAAPRRGFLRTAGRWGVNQRINPSMVRTTAESEPAAVMPVAAPVPARDTTAAKEQAVTAAARTRAGLRCSGLLARSSLRDALAFML